MAKRSSIRNAFFALLLSIAAGISVAPAADKIEQLNLQLAFAAATGTADDVNKLLQQGVDPNNARNTAGAAALALAAMRKDTNMAPVVEALLAAKASLEIEDTMKQTPLFYAAKNGSKDGALLLLKHGADYYHKDKQGNAARDIAYKENHPEVAEAMDAFMQTKAKSMMEQYDQRNKEIETRNKELEDRNKAIAENNATIEQRNKQIAEHAAQLEKRNKELEKKNKAIKQEIAKAELEKQQAMIAQRQASQQQAQLAQQQAGQPAPPQQFGTTPPAAPPAPAPPKPVDYNKMQSLVYDTSFHTCAAEYWRFCRANKQESSIKLPEIKALMAAHITLADDAAQTLRKEFGANDAYLRNITVPSAKQIHDQLNVYVTKAQRTSEGIGKKEDMEARCADIADQWEVEKPGSVSAAMPQSPPPAPPPRKR